MISFSSIPRALTTTAGKFRQYVSDKRLQTARKDARKNVDQQELRAAFSTHDKQRAEMRPMTRKGEKKVKFCAAPPESPDSTDTLLAMATALRDRPSEAKRSLEQDIKELTHPFRRASDGALPHELPELLNGVAHLRKHFKNEWTTASQLASDGKVDDFVMLLDRVIYRLEGKKLKQP